MPKIVLTVPETDESISRPVILDITRQLFVVTGLSSKTSISFFGDTGKGKQPGSAIGHEGEDNLLPFDSRVFIEVAEDYEMNRMTSTAVYYPENQHIFRDDRIDTSIKPVYSSSEVTINFRYRAVDKVSAIRWRDDIRSRVAMGQDIRTHDISYHYLIPPEFLVILKELHRMREAVAGYGETYDQYFKANVTQRASELTNLSGSFKKWGIAERQMRIVGHFDFDGVPEQGSREGDGDGWTIAVAYKFKYDKPISCVMMYPIVVHNQLLDQKYRPTELPYDDEAIERSYTLSSMNFGLFEKSRQILNTPQGISIPNFDEFLPSNIVNSTIRVFTALVTIDPLKPLALFSLKNLGEIVLDPAIIDFMLGEVPFMTRPYQSIFSLSLYVGPTLQLPSKVTINSALDISLTSPPDLRSTHHIRLGIVTDLSLLTDAARDRLREHGLALTLLLDAIDPSLHAKGLLPPYIGYKGPSVYPVVNWNNGYANNGGTALGSMNGNDNANGTLFNGSGNAKGSSGNGGSNPSGVNYVGKQDLKNAIDEINRVTISQGNHQIYQRNTVMTLFLQSKLDPYAIS